MEEKLKKENKLVFNGTEDCTSFRTSQSTCLRHWDLHAKKLLGTPQKVLLNVLAASYGVNLEVCWGVNCKSWLRGTILGTLSISVIHSSHSGAQLSSLLAIGHTPDLQSPILSSQVACIPLAFANCEKAPCPRPFLVGSSRWKKPVRSSLPTTTRRFLAWKYSTILIQYVHSVNMNELQRMYWITYRSHCSVTTCAGEPSVKHWMKPDLLPEKMQSIPFHSIPFHPIILVYIRDACLKHKLERYEPCLHCMKDLALHVRKND